MTSQTPDPYQPKRSRSRAAALAVAAAAKSTSMPARTAYMNRIGRRGGFTLVEVLVVIGIIGLLIAVLLPALAAVRRKAATAACAANLRELGNLAATWAGDHDGFLPLAGEVNTPVEGSPRFDVGFDDAGRRRYDYLPESAGYVPNNASDFLPAMVRLAAGPDRAAALEDSSSDWAVDVRPVARVAGLLDCPGVDRSHLWANRGKSGFPGAISITEGERIALGWDTTSDYATNGGLLGFQHDSTRSHRAYRGQLSRVRTPARMALAGDGDGDFTSWTPAADRPGGRATLRDVLERTGEVTFWGLRRLPQLDADRHDSRANMAFVDGHVGAVPVDAEALSRVDLLQE